jgi:hypothetical protein
MNGCTSKDGGEVLAPPPIPTPSNQWHVPLPFFHSDQLYLVLYLRHQMAYQAYRGALMSQSMDMFYEALSDAPAKQKCPTCARLYAMPAQYEIPSDDP